MTTPMQDMGNGDNDANNNNNMDDDNDNRMHGEDNGYDHDDLYGPGIGNTDEGNGHVVTYQE